MGRFVAFGEIMLRLSPPGRELMLQTPRLDVWTAGAEANVATALARLGHETAMVSALPDTPLGDAALTALRGQGVDTRGILRRDGRMALYFVTSGAGLRATEVIYDRAGSVFAAMPADAWDWDVLLQGADRLHLSGITPALGPGGTATAIAAAEAATRLGVPVSFDGNYRARLWEAWDGRPHETLRRLIAHADILFGDHRDIALVLGAAFDGEDRDKKAMAAAFDAFPRLRVIAHTDRRTIDVDQHLLCAMVATRDDHVRTPDLKLSGIVDRIGAGDAFASGVLHALRLGQDVAQAARSGLALAALKHSQPGDASLFGRRDLESFLSGGFDVRR